VDGTAKLARGNVGATSQDIFTIDTGGGLNVSAATASGHVVNLGLADARYAALLGNIANKFSVAAGVAATDAVNVGQFTTGQVKTTTSGNQQLPGGLILKWGYVASVPNSPFTITFPTAFPTAGVYANYIFSANNSAGDANSALTAISASSFSGANSNSLTANLYWFAIGY
jgi:hypothetical protein